MQSEENSIQRQKKLEEAEYDPARRAELALESVLQKNAAPDSDSHTTVDEALGGAELITHESNRAMSRVLFVTTDLAYLEKGSVKMQTLERIATLFHELHILVLVPGGIEEKTERVSATVWTYRASASYWWWRPWAGRRKIADELSFGGGFRPDIVVALDPFESGLCAYLIGNTFARPVQVHVLEDIYHPLFYTKKSNIDWLLMMAKYVLRRVTSVRTCTQNLMETIQKKFPRIPDVQTLPQFYNFSAFTHAQPAFNVHEKYTDFSFIMVAWGPLTADSHLHETFTAIHTLLHNPRIGLIVVGEGPAKSLFEEKVKLLGIQKNVVFVDTSVDLVSYFKTADVLIQTDVGNSSEEVVLKAAAAGLPTIMYETDLRRDLFTHGDSASICPVGDTVCIGKEVGMFLNNHAIRVQYQKAARHVIETRLDQDETTYYRAYRDSIELVLAAEKGS